MRMWNPVKELKADVSEPPGDMPVVVESGEGIESS